MVSMGEVRAQEPVAGANVAGSAVRVVESKFLEVVTDGVGEGAIGWWPLGAGLSVDSMYMALMWIVTTVGNMMEERGEVVTKRAVLEATGNMILGWDLLKAETEWRSNWAPDEALARAFVQICNENGFEVGDRALQERGDVS